jgi:hypothetical protein
MWPCPFTQNAAIVHLKTQLSYAQNVVIVHLKCSYCQKENHRVPCLLTSLFESEVAYLPAKIANRNSMCPCLHFNQNAAIVHLETQLLSAQNVAIVNSCCCLTNHPSFAPSRATQYSTPPDHPLADSTQASKRPVCHCFLLCRSGGRASQYLLYKPPSRPLNFYSRPLSSPFRKFSDST